MRQPGKRVLLAGGSGFVGQALAEHLSKFGYEVALLSRQKEKGFWWEPSTGRIDPEAIAWADAVVNLAGERITDGDWTPRRKEELIDSRLDATRLLVGELNRQSGATKLFLSASAYGVYGEQGNQMLTEATPPIPRANFLAHLCQQWEQAAQTAPGFGTRTVLMRIGLVLSYEEGLLAGLTKALRFGVGAPFGSGQQIQSWIHIADLCGLFEQAIRDDRWQGPINAVAPHPVSNRELVETLAQVQGRRIWLPRIPATLLRWRLGEKSEFLLASHWLSANYAQQLGYQYRFPSIRIDGLVETYRGLIEAQWGRTLTWETDDIALQNIQARVRAPSIWLLANLSNALLLTTSNRSEAAVGYATMDGDTAGSISPITGIDKHFLRSWLRWLETIGLNVKNAWVSPDRSGTVSQPAKATMIKVKGLRAVNRLQPSAELRPLDKKQIDEEDLMPYDVLNTIEEAAIRDKQSPLESLRIVRVRFADRYELAQLALWVERFFTLWSRNQWKRERYAPSFMLDDHNLDPRSWCRFPILSGGYERELQEMLDWLKKHGV